MDLHILAKTDASVLPSASTMSISKLNQYFSACPGLDPGKRDLPRSLPP
jgi:hypothetical protein